MKFIAEYATLYSLAHAGRKTFMKVAVPNQITDGETRVALTPSVVKRLIGREIEVDVEAGAGLGAMHADSDYESVGAEIVLTTERERIWSADVVVTVDPPTVDDVKSMREGTILAGVLHPTRQHELVQALQGRKTTAFAMEFVPRITRAQSMDVLSSQANMGGYKAVLLAANHSAKMFPMMMTAAGTISPAKVFIIGAGVAGLQAIATAKRLGAIVEAYDIRPVVEEQVKSLGARFVKLAIKAEDAETAGGYAKEQTEEDRQKQAELMAKHVIGADCVITTAALFGKAPPMLIPADVVNQMKAGSVLIDIAADPDAGRGNCEATKPGEVYTTEHGVIIDGTLNLPATLSVDASQAYANNIFAFLEEITENGSILLDLEDEVQQGALITHQGEIRNELVKTTMESAG